MEVAIAVSDRDLPVDSGVALARRVDAAPSVHSLWINETGHADATVTLGAWAAVTNRVVLATGVIPLSARSEAQLDIAAAHLLRMAGRERLLLGIGVGQRHAAETVHKRQWRSPLDWTSNAITRLHTLEPSPQVLVGALGPNMLALAGREADGALLNWTTAEHARKQRAVLLESATAAARRDVLLCGYVRVAVGPDAEVALAHQVSFYHRLPFYRQHWDAMGSPENHLITIASRDGSDLRARLAEFDALDVAVARIVPTDDFGLDAVVDLLCQ